MDFFLNVGTLASLLWRRRDGCFFVWRISFLNGHTHIRVWDTAEHSRTASSSLHTQTQALLRTYFKSNLFCIILIMVLS